MKKKTFLLFGMITGLIIGVAVPSFAEDAVKHVTAAVNETFQIEVDGEMADLPEGYELLVYQNRSYLPLRAVADMVGADITWREDSRRILIQQKKNICDKIDTTASGKLPQSIETLDYKITASALMKDDQEGTRLYLHLKNKDESVLRLDQESVVFITDSTEYPYSAIDSLNYDNRWYTICLEKDEEAEGYLRLPKKLAGSRNVKIMLNLTQDGNSDPISVTFYLEEC